VARDGSGLRVKDRGSSSAQSSEMEGDVTRLPSYSEFPLTLREHRPASIERVMAGTVVRVWGLFFREPVDSSERQPVPWTKLA